MTRLPFIIFTALLILLDVGLMPALASPWRGIALTPIFLIGLVAQGRSSTAWPIALLSGLAHDTVSTLPPGTYPLLLLGLVWMIFVLSHRSLTNRSWISFLALQMIGAAFFFTSIALCHIIFSTVLHDASLIISGREALTVIGYGVAFSTGTAMLILLLERYARTLLGRRFVFSARVQRI